MPTGNIDDKLNPARKIKQYAASASVRDLVADSIDTKTCARAIKLLGSGSFTSAKDASDTLIQNTGGVAGTIGPLIPSDVIEGPFSSLISADQPFIAFW